MAHLYLPSTFLRFFIFTRSDNFHLNQLHIIMYQHRRGHTPLELKSGDIAVGKF